MSRGGGRTPVLAEGVPWRAPPPGQKPLPRIHHNPVLRVSQSPSSAYALAVMKHANPIGEGFATEARLEAAGPDCIVPGQVTPIKLLGLKVWPIDVNLKFLEPVGQELQSVGKHRPWLSRGYKVNLQGHVQVSLKQFLHASKFLDAAVNLMNASFQDR